MKNNHKFEIILVSLFLIIAVVVVSFVFDVFNINTKTSTITEEEEPVTVEFCYAFQNPMWDTAIRQVIKDFESENPDILIQYEIAYEDTVYENYLTKKIARGELADIVQLKTILPYAKSDLLGSISEDTAALVDETYEYNGNIVGVGAVETTWGILFNRDIFDKYGIDEPISIDEFYVACEKLKDEGVVPIGVAGGDLWHMEYWVNHYFRTDIIADNENWLAECMNGECSWTDDSVTKMLEDLKYLFDNGYVNSDWQTTSDIELSYRLKDSEIAMVYTGPWTAASISQEYSVNLGWFYLPLEDGRVQAADNFDTYFAISKECEADSEKYEAAMKFLQFFYSSDEYAYVYHSIYAFPTVNADIKNDMTDIESDIVYDFENADLYSEVYIGNEDTPENFEKGMLNIICDIMAEQISIEDGQEKLQILWEQCKGDVDEE